MKTRGAYYANATVVRPDQPGKRFGVQVARQAKTLREACLSIDEFADQNFSGRGYVQLWVEAEQRRYIVAERDEAGNWWALSYLTGDLLPFNPYAKAAS